MKILLINGSLRGEYSSSLKVAHAFVKGMVEEYGADTEVCEVALKDKRIDHCHGCFVCWKTTPGQCCIHDDMDELRQMVMDSDIIVESFPLLFLWTAFEAEGIYGSYDLLCTGVSRESG